MPSSYTQSLRLILPVTGELTGAWGDAVNAGLTELVEDAIAGTAAITMTNANLTLSAANEAADQARNMIIALSDGSLTATRDVICPAVSKLYFVRNNTTGGQSIRFKTAAGAGITVANNRAALLYCDGTNVVDAISTVALGNYTETVFSITDGTTVNLNPNQGPIQTWTLGANRTPGQTSWAEGQSITLLIDDGTARTITWTTLAVVWKTDGGVAPTLNTTGSTVIVLWKVGTTIYGARVGDA